MAAAVSPMLSASTLAGGTRAAALAGLAVIAVDQATKQWVIHDVRTRMTLFGVLRLVHRENPSFGSGRYAASPWVALAFGLAFLVILGLLANACAAPLSTWIALGVIGGGVVSNTIDRIRIGAVTDFIRIGQPIDTNLADVAVVLGGVGLVVSVVQAWVSGARAR